MNFNGTSCGQNAMPDQGLQNENFSKNSFTKTFRVSNSFDPDQALRFVVPDLGPKCLLGYQQMTLAAGVINWLIILFCCLLIFFKLNFNPIKPMGISQSYQLDKSIYVLRVVGWYFPFLYEF